MKVRSKFFALIIILTTLVSMLLVPPNLSFAATTPAKISVVVTNDPSKSVKIIWKDYGDAIQIQKDDGSGVFNSERTVTSVNRQAIVDQLIPNTKYLYKVIDTANNSCVSKVYSFKTAPEVNNTESFKFIYLTDPQISGSSEEQNLKVILDKANEEQASLLCCPGDFVNYDSGESDGLWNSFFNSAQNLMANKILAATEGNHDDEINHTFLDKYFGFPDGSTAYKYTYSFNYGMVHISVINTSYDGDAEELSNRVKSDLKANSDKKWRIVLMHKSLYSTGDHCNDSDIVTLREALAPAFQDGKADITLGGHDHTFTRGFVNYNSITKTSANPFLGKPEMIATNVTQPEPFTPFYIVGNTASTDQRYPLNINNAVTLDKSESMDDQTYVTVDVSESSITFTSNNYLDGKWTVYDKYTINKSGTAQTSPPYVTSTPTPTLTSTIISGEMNIASNGTGYVWSDNSEASSNSNKVGAAAVNDSNTSTAASCSFSSSNKWNGAGVTFFTSQNGITKVEFINGDISNGDGNFEGNCKLQFSADGSTWSDSGWSISPAYPYNETASGVKYTFSGTARNNIKGVRVVGQVRINDMSYFFILKEFNVYASNGALTATPTATATPTSTSRATTVKPTATPTSTTPQMSGLNKPFGQNINFANCIKPNLTQQQLNADVTKYYDQWKSLLVKQTKDGKTMCYVKADGTGGDNPKRVSHSEAHGYGMIITALMAGYEPNAKEIFDGFYNVYAIDKSPGKNTMNWEIQSDLTNSGDGSATDGDLDVAYALLLADKQWGSKGQINYLAEAKKMIEDIKKYDINQTYWSVKCADSGWPSDNTTRPSDWMADHFRAFQGATGDLDWNKVSNKIYSIISDVKNQGISTSGLVPDFLILNSNNTLKAATDSEIGGGETNCGDYAYNACRVPWRLATDYAHYGTAEAKSALNDMLNTIKNKTSGDPAKINDGYKLDGDVFSSYQSLAFTSPLIAACITNPSNQDYLDKGWNYIKARHDEYYGDTINLMCMLLISGNWWSPYNSGTTTVNNLDLNHDGAINMTDIMILAKVFNSVRNDSRYVVGFDLNCDGAINMSDIMLVAAKFNTVV